MAKRTYKILRFDGGINNDADPRDIGDNQFADLQNVAVDEMGKIIVLGDVQTQRKDLAGDITGQGRGLFACSTDHTGFLNDGVTPAAPGQTYYLVEDGDTIRGIGENGETDTIACNMNEASMYYVGGALRIAEADVTSADVTPVWRGFVEGRTYNPGSSSGVTTISEQWATVNAEIKGAFEVFTPTYASLSANVKATEFCKNAIFINVQDDLGTNATDFNQAVSCTATDTDYDGLLATATSDHEWGFQLEFDESSDGNGSGTWMPTPETRYKFYITTMYDDHAQESLPQLMRMHSSTQVLGGLTWAGKVVESEIYFTNGNTDEEGENVAVYFAPTWKTIGSAYNFGAANTDDNTGGNLRISGVRLYWASNEDSYTTLWQLFDIKFDEGAKLIGIDGGGGGTSGYSPFKENAGGNGHVSIDISADNVWSNPPRYYQYDVLNAHSHTDIIKVDSYKTAAVANRRVYIGNVKQDGKIHGDRMLKSPVNQFDKFPSINNIDVAIHDGDDIVALVEYADRILQFKKNTCYIINVSGNTEYLEAEHKFKGITNPGAACRTDYGAAWANQNGCYMYDGQQVTDLLEDQGMRKINQSTWSTFIGTDNYHRIGFNPFKRQLIVLQGTSGDNAYVYDMVTKSWTFSANMVADGDTGSNFINDPVDGSLLIYNETGTEIDKWADDPIGDTTPSIVIITKDIDFGEPAVRKKVYKAYVSYKSGSTCSAVATYGIDGDTTPTTAVSSGGSFSTSQSAWTVQEIVFGSGTNSCKSIQLKIAGAVDKDFAINDISFVYRTKGIK